MSGAGRAGISSTSRKPRVVTRPMRAPLRSRSALVPTVVPCTTEPSCKRAEALQAFEKPNGLVARLDGTFAVRNCAASSS